MRLGRDIGWPKWPLPFRVAIRMAPKIDRIANDLSAEIGDITIGPNL
jgi:hypothetical protein